MDGMTTRWRWSLSHVHKVDDPPSIYLSGVERSLLHFMDINIKHEDLEDVKSWWVDCEFIPMDILISSISAWPILLAELKIMMSWNVLAAPGRHRRIAQSQSLLILRLAGIHGRSVKGTNYHWLVVWLPWIFNFPINIGLLIIPIDGHQPG